MIRRVRISLEIQLHFCIAKFIMIGIIHGRARAQVSRLLTWLLSEARDFTRSFLMADSQNNLISISHDKSLGLSISIMHVGTAWRILEFGLPPHFTAWSYTILLMYDTYQPATPSFIEIWLVAFVTSIRLYDIR